MNSVIAEQTQNNKLILRWIVLKMQKYGYVNLTLHIAETVDK